MKRLLPVAMVLVALLITASVFAAAEKIAAPEEKKPEYVLPYPGILPDHPLYFLKQIRDGIMDFLIVDPLRKAEFHLLQADKRLAMGKLLVERGKRALGEATVSEGERYLERAAKDLSAVKAAGRPVPANLIDRLDRAREKHGDVVTALGFTGELEVIRKLGSEIEKLK